MEILQAARNLGHRRAQEMVQDILDTFYTWPLVLPQELVYFFRATALLEGIALRYDPAFNGLKAVKPVVDRLKGEILLGPRREPVAAARDALSQAEHALRALYDLVGRAEREELRLRAHPRDVLQYERFTGLMVRRILLGLFASVLAVVSTLIFVATQNWLVLSFGNAFALFLFLIVLVVPKHLLENPVRRARDVRRGNPSGR
jgi:predicted unusual protein kinase regulating ubiquinone biosynthesis (AarF/ABC1/UbiB family)